MNRGKGKGMNSAEFMRLMRDGKTDDAFKGIYKQSEALSRSACSGLGVFNERDQEDVYHSTMLDLFRAGWKTFDERCSLSTYIYGIALRRAVDFLRKKGRSLPDAPKAEEPSDESMNDARDPKLTQDEVLEMKDSFDQRLCAQMAIQELERLNPRWAAAIRAYAEEESSREDLAHLLGVTLGSLANLISRIRRELRRLCEEHCGSADCSAVVAR